MTGNYRRRTGLDLCFDHRVDDRSCSFADYHGCYCRDLQEGKAVAALHGRICGCLTVDAAAMAGLAL